MKILILLKKYEGGVGSAVKYLSKEFEKKGHEVKIISREDDLNIFDLKGSIFPIRRLVSNLMRKENFDVIYVQDWSMAFPLLFPRKIFFNKLFCVFYGENPKKQIGGYYLQKIIGRMMGRRLIVCNNHLKQTFKKSNLIYNRVDHNSFKPSKKVKRIKNSVGFANWKTEMYRFSEIKKAVISLGKKLVIAENISKEEMPEFFRELECFISLPPSYAGFGLVYLEAMSSGVPKIIGSKFGGGDVLPITKIEDYGGDIEKAILGAKKMDYRKWVLKNKFTWEDATDKLEKIFEKRV